MYTPLSDATVEEYVMTQTNYEIEQPIQCRVQYHRERWPNLMTQTPGVARYRVVSDPRDALTGTVSADDFDEIAKEVFHIDGIDRFVKSMFYETGLVALFLRTGVSKSHKNEFAKRLCTLMEQKKSKK